MIAELGNFSLILAFMISIVLGTIPLVGAQTGNLQWMNVAKSATAGQAVFIGFAFACLAYAFLTDDFSVQYVQAHSNSAMPGQYKFAGIWGGHEGSLLLWVLFLTAWMVAVSVFSNHLPLDMVARVLGVMGLVSIGFISFMLFTSNPFDRVLPGLPEGNDLNPLLQDFGLVIHPPMLYMGYVGFSVAFSFAIAALLSGKIDSTWIRWTRPWTTVAWMFLSLGIALGSWWAYYELGWGGWWFWDPVENASFMPWLAGTALIHSLAVTEKRGTFRSFSILLAIIAFSLSLLGTFLVRSGVLTSVHSFASDPARGLYILVFLLIVVGGSLSLYAWRFDNLRSTGKFYLFSKETFLLVANILLVCASAVVLFGTLAPILYEWLMGKSISVGAPWFNKYFIPIAFVVAIIMGIGPNVYWKKGNMQVLIKQVLPPFIAAVVATLLLTVLFAGDVSHAAKQSWLKRLYFPMGMFMATWIIFATLFNVRGRLQMLRQKGSLKARVIQIPSSFFGMVFAHLGLAVTIIGICAVSNFEVEKDVRVSVGEIVEVKGYAFRLVKIEKVKGPNYDADRGFVEISRGTDLVTVLTPEKRAYRSQRTNTMTEAGIDAGLFKDLYVSLGNTLKNPSNPNEQLWEMRIYYKPFVDWIWAGAGFMALGGILVISDKRYRVGRRERKRSPAGEAERLATSEAERKPV